MRILVLSILFGCSVMSFSQNLITGRVYDSRTNEALPYCSISIKGTGEGTITNSEGSFSITTGYAMDTLVFSYLGYVKRVIPSGKLTQNEKVLMERQEIHLQEVTIHATDDYLYDIMEKCRRRLIEDRKALISKVYYGIETQAKDQPIELVECYYNGYMNGPSIGKLLLKNGRIGLAGLDNRYFLTLNSSKAISSIDMTKKSDFYPNIPLQFSKRGMKKEFTVNVESVDNEIIRIKFQPCNNQTKSFSGEIWVDKADFTPLKIDLMIRNSSTHPFLPMFPMDSVYDIDLAISQTYKQNEGYLQIDHINFNYHFKYKSVRDTPQVTTRSIITRDINTKGILYFYDYGKPFILPYFEYSSDYDDYRKMSIIPYNNTFWRSNTTVLLTENQKEDLGFFADQGHLINYREGNYGNDFVNLPGAQSTLYENYYTFWSADHRIILDQKMEQNRAWTQDEINRSIQTGLINLKVQILLDANQVHDSILCKSYTVFDADKTYYHLPEESYTNTFLNIYFDICEIERRKMEIQLSSGKWSVSQVDSIYLFTVKNVDEMTCKYLNEVQLGKSEKALQKWNNYVKENLGIDNIELFGE